MFLSLVIGLVAISISAVAAYYSIIGLAAIFAAAAIPIIIMGIVLEIGKVAGVIWLHTNCVNTDSAFVILDFSLLILLSNCSICTELFPVPIS